MDYSFSKIFKNQKWFIANRFLGPTIFLFSTYFFREDNLFVFFFKYETLIIVTSLIASILIKKNYLNLFYFLGIMMSILIIIPSLLINYKLLLISLAICEAINFYIAFYINRTFFLKFHSAYLTLNFLAVLILGYYDFDFSYFLIFNIINLCIFNIYFLRNKTIDNNKLNNKAGISSIVRNVFNAFGRNTIINLDNSFFSFVILKFINQATIFIWSYIKSAEGINFNSSVLNNNKLIKFSFITIIILLVCFFTIDKFLLLIYTLIIFNFLIIEIHYAKKNTFSK